MKHDMTIEQFCDRHKACKEGRDWALASCSTMQEVWDTAKPEWLIWVATRRGVLTDKELRLFAVFAARQVQHLMADPRSTAAIDIAERFAHSKASVEELEAANAAAKAAMEAIYATRATDYTAITAAKAAAKAAAAAAYAAATYAADAATIATADEADEAEETTQRAAARKAQAQWLRQNTTPKFQ